MENQEKGHTWQEGKMNGPTGPFQAFVCPKCGLLVVAAYKLPEYPAGSKVYLESHHAIIVGVKDANDKITAKDCTTISAALKVPCYG